MDTIQLIALMLDVNKSLSYSKAGDFSSPLTGERGIFSFYVNFFNLLEPLFAHLKSRNVLPELFLEQLDFFRVDLDKTGIAVGALICQGHSEKVKFIFFHFDHFLKHIQTLYQTLPFINEFLSVWMRQITLISLSENWQRKWLLCKIKSVTLDFLMLYGDCWMLVYLMAILFWGR
jgi:hypothetical protein